MLKELLVILIASSLVNNVVLSQFLGLCPFLGVSKKTETATGMGVAVIFVITLASAVAGAIYQFILIPFDIAYLQTIVFILVIAALVQFVEMFLKKFIPGLYQSLGVYLPLITTNCAVLGVALTNVQKNYGILTGVVNGFATAVGFTISIIILAGIREKLKYNDIPESFQGMPIVLVVVIIHIHRHVKPYPADLVHDGGERLQIHRHIVVHRHAQQIPDRRSHRRLDKNLD